MRQPVVSVLIQHAESYYNSEGSHLILCFVEGAYSKIASTTQSSTMTAPRVNSTTTPRTVVIQTPTHRPNISRYEGISNKNMQITNIANSMSSSGKYRDLFTENLKKQSQNHQLHSEVLQLQKVKMQIGVEMGKVELQKAKLDLEAANLLAKIEIHKRKRLAELEIEKKQKELAN